MLRPSSHPSLVFLLALLLACIPGCGIPGLYGTSAQARSSGGYSRPSTSSSSYRRPSYSAPFTGRSSGGYSAPSRRPSTGYVSAPSFGGDAAISKRASGQAFESYRNSQAPTRQPTGYSGAGDRRPSTGYSGGGYGGSGYSAQPWAPAYAPPSYGWAQSGRSFGAWDGLMLWSLLHSLSAPGHAAFFHNQQDTPAYQQWRAEAQRSAASDPEVRTKLAELDQRLAQMQGQPREPNTPAPPVARPSHGVGMTGIILVLLLVAVFVTLWYWRRRADATARISGTPTPVAPAALRGSTLTRFRVGMTIPVDPSPFILAGSATKIKPPDGGMISVEAVGVLMDGAIPLNCLYLPGRTSFFQLHLGTDGKPDECRYFSRVDQITPATQDEWGAWLDPAQGMIGWPQFQTKDGKMYDRVWAPGSERIEPRALEETIQDLKGTSSRKLVSMLYASPTGIASPGPAQEYILVSGVHEGDQAWVDIHAGIDINPSALTLPAVALS